MKKILFFLLIAAIDLPAFAQVPSYVNTTGLLAWYPFNSNVNNAWNPVMDNGVIYGGVTYGTDRFGAPSSCYVGNGASGVDIPLNDFPVGNVARSLAFWYKSVLPYPGGDREIMAWGDNAAVGTRFGSCIHPPSIGFESVGVGQQHNITLDSSWHHIAITYPVGGTGLSSIKIYYDGVIATSFSLGALGSLNTATGFVHCIGTLFIAGFLYSWVGSLDDIGVWAREISPCEVSYLYGNHIPFFVAGNKQTLTICNSATPLSLNSLLAVNDSDVGQSETWTVLTAPSHGTLIGSYTTTTTGLVLTPTGLSYTPVSGYIGIDSFKVIVTDCGGAADTATFYVHLVAPPAAVTITGPSPYCQFSPFVPFTVTGYTDTLEWYTTGTGGIGSSTPIVVNTSIPGYTTVWVSQHAGSCESPRDSITIHVIPTPGAPIVTGPTEYCQFIGPFIPLVATHTATGTLRWYNVATGGVPSPAEPTVNINVAGTTDMWVSQIDSTCESARAHASVVVHPKPAPPVVAKQQYCLNATASPLSIAPSGTGDILTFFGAGIPGRGTTSVPIPPTITVGLIIDSVNEKTSFGCISDMAIDTITIKPIPAVPVTRDTTYCQFSKAAALTADSIPGDRLRWYSLGSPLPLAPVPTNAVAGDSTWYVAQFYNGCESDSVPLKVTTIYKPSFTIIPSKPWVCQFDSISLAYNGPALNNPGYIWSIPFGSYYAHLNGPIQSLNTDSVIMVRFDSVTTNDSVQLTATDNGGFCYSNAGIKINVIPKPYARSYSKRDVCIGDTVSLAIGSKSAEASQFTWQVDNIPFTASTALNILSSNSNSGGPYVISWNDSGRHVIIVNTSTEEGCKSLPAYDTVDVHTLPDASFKVTMAPGSLCLEDSVLFTANTNDYNYAYVWSPAHFFNNVNRAVIWGHVEQTKSIVTLMVTDPFGCVASNSVEIDPGSCCTVSFPNAFSPDGDGHNDFFKPIFAGYHRFHIFRIANRWGQTVYESTNDNMKWDGTFNGVPQDVGVYYYYIKFDCGGNTMEQTGDVTLIR